MPSKKKKIGNGKSSPKTAVDQTPIVPIPSQSVDPKPEKVWDQIDPNLLAGKAMLLIDAIEKEIQQGHLQEWTAVAERLSVLVQSNKPEN